MCTTQAFERYVDVFRHPYFDLSGTVFWLGLWIDIKFAEHVQSITTHAAFASLYYCADKMQSMELTSTHTLSLH